MSTSIKDFIEKETVNRRNFLLASATGMGAMALSCVAGALRSPIEMSWKTASRSARHAERSTIASPVLRPVPAPPAYSTATVTTVLATACSAWCCVSRLVWLA